MSERGVIGQIGAKLRRAVPWLSKQEEPPEGEPPSEARAQRPKVAPPPNSKGKAAPSKKQRRKQAEQAQRRQRREQEARRLRQEARRAARAQKRSKQRGRKKADREQAASRPGAEVAGASRDAAPAERGPAVSRAPGGPAPTGVSEAVEGGPERAVAVDPSARAPDTPGSTTGAVDVEPASTRASSEADPVAGPGEPDPAAASPEPTVASESSVSCAGAADDAASAAVGAVDEGSAVALRERIAALEQRNAELERQLDATNARRVHDGRRLIALEKEKQRLVLSHGRELEAQTRKSEDRIREATRDADAHLRELVQRVEQMEAARDMLEKRLGALRFSSAANTGVRLHQILGEFTKAYHDHGKSLETVRDTLQSTLRFLGDDTLRHGHSGDELWKALQGPIHDLVHGLHGLLGELEAQASLLGLSAPQLRTLKRRYDILAPALRRPKTDFELEVLASELGREAHQLGGPLGRVEEASIKALSKRSDAAALRLRQALTAVFRQVRDACHELDRVACLYQLHDSRQTITECLEQNDGAQARVDAILRGEIDDPAARPTERGSLTELVNRAMEHYIQRARTREIALPQPFPEDPARPIQVNPETLLQALRALFQNALKYSKQTTIHYVDTEKAGTAWIKVDFTDSPDAFTVAIESWGLPITAYELEKGLIFEYGQRGAYALRSDRKGSGYGLWYSKAAIEAHGGRLDATSVPARPNEVDPDDPYAGTFKTTFRVTLPRARPPSAPA